MNKHDLANTITWGKDSNLYIGGKTIEPGGDAFSIISLTPEGEERWTYLPTWDGYNGIWSILVGDDLNVYAAGWIGEKGGPERYAFSMGIASVTTEGNERWHLTYSGSYRLTAMCDQVVWDSNRNLLLAVGFTNDVQEGVMRGRCHC